MKGAKGEAAASMRASLSLLLTICVGLEVSSRHSVQVTHHDEARRVQRVISRLGHQVSEREQWKLISSEREKYSTQDSWPILQKKAEFMAKHSNMLRNQHSHGFSHAGGTDEVRTAAGGPPRADLKSSPAVSSRGRRAFVPGSTKCSCPDACQTLTAERGRIKDGFRPHCPSFKAGGLYPNGLDDCW